MEAASYTLLAAGLAAVFYGIAISGRAEGVTARSKGLSQKEMAAVREEWKVKLRRIHRAERLFLIPLDQASPRAIRKYEKRAGLDVKVHRLRLPSAGDGPAYELNAIEFPTTRALQAFHARVSAKGLEPNAADEILG